MFYIYFSLMVLSLGLELAIAFSYEWNPDGLNSQSLIIFSSGNMLIFLILSYLAFINALKQYPKSILLHIGLSFFIVSSTILLLGGLFIFSASRDEKVNLDIPAPNVDLNKEVSPWLPYRPVQLK